ncbi:DHA2 family efflux MFS transporter permease subunit [Sneathiella litorea]|uniref:DHA2 family efflux MFS transporter permease subunit n=1 Tax=Sneathiella litorea TaxID=2606216 RepID=A0A6L8WBJ2_9PROT|nr:DHA2 family efflux MFS transporter permease subunit [Sneathiella litorea]MZR31793.1 DHA2 family efflux MFS transporter permease subunit [Sneathiella litorea]
MSSKRLELLEQKYGASFKWFAVLAVIFGLLASIFSSTMINVALTNIMADYSVTQASAQWMSTGFLCANAVCMLTSAWLLQNFGARKTFLFASTLFFTGCMIGQFAPAFNLLIFARILQGAGAGIIQPLSMALVFMLFPENKRGSAIGTFSMVVVLGPAVGPTIGGVITDVFDWHYTFTAALPLSLFAAIAGWIFLPDRDDNQQSSRFNIISFCLIGLTVGTLLTGLSNSQFYPMEDPQVIVYLVISLISFILFFRRERRSKSPLLRLDMFRNLKFTSTVIVGAITSAGMFSTIYMLPLFARTVQLSDATDAGLLLLPGGLALAIVSPIAGRLVDRLPAHRLLFTGIILFVISIYALTLADKASGFWMIAGWVVIGRAALGLILPANSTLSLSSVAGPQVPQASGALNFCRMLGGTIGVNIIAVLITARSAHYGAEIMAANGGEALTVEQTVEMMTLTFHDCFMVSGVVFAFALIPVIYLARHAKQ